MNWDAGFLTGICRIEPASSSSDFRVFWCSTPGEPFFEEKVEISGRPELNEVDADLRQLARRKYTDATTYPRLVNARIGQGEFRQELYSRWDGRCALTGIKTDALLRASHIQPWSDSTDTQRLDGANGLLLAAHVDALFDRYLLSYTDEGETVWSDDVCDDDRTRLGLPARLRRVPTEKEREYLVKHRQLVTRTPSG